MMIADAKFAAALFACLLFGLHHGFDYDHLAAITDITAVQRNWKSGMRLGVTYALGHAFTVIFFGVLILSLHIGLPERLDHWTEKLIGLTLVLLGIGVAVGLIRKRPHIHHHAHEAKAEIKEVAVHGHLHAHEVAACEAEVVPLVEEPVHTHDSSHVHVESRIAAAINGLLWMGWMIRRFFVPEAVEPKRFKWNYSGKSVFLIGVIHGVGAETPSQLALFVVAKSLGGIAHGLMGLGAFAVGLVLMNTVMTASLGGLFGASGPKPRLFKAISWAGAIYSFAIGLIFLLGVAEILPAL